MDKGIAYMQRLLDLEHQLVLTKQLRSARIDWSGGLDTEARHEQAVADRAYELEVELSVESLMETLLEHNLHQAKDTLEGILHELAECQLKAWTTD